MADPDPTELADQLPERPLTPDETTEIAERFGWSCSRVVYETTEGSEYVPLWFAFEPTEQRTGAQDEVRGDALGFEMNNEMTDWTGQVEQTDVAESTWLQVCEMHAQEMCVADGLELQSVKTEGGERRLSDDVEGSS